jgi:hypothetical protein
MENKKFEFAIENYINGNKKDFRKFLKSLTKLQLLQFSCYVSIHCSEILDIFDIEKEFSI